MNPLSASQRVSHSDLQSTSDSFDEFLQQRRYLKNVTPSTIEWFDTAFKAFRRAHAGTPPPVTKASLHAFVVALRERAVKPVTCNT